MSILLGQPVTEQERAALSAQAGDVIAVVDASGVVTWWSDGVHPTGLQLADALVADDARLLGAVLGTSTTGPHWLRLLDEHGHGRWMAVLAVPREQGWVVEFRDVRTLGPAAGVPEQHGGIADRDQVLHEVAWLLAATPRTGKETAVVTIDLPALPDVTHEHGRLASEEVMDVITGRISDDLRSGDLVARVGPSRLLVILRGVHDLKGSVEVVRRLQEVVAEPVILDTVEVTQTIAAGVTLISRGESVDSVLDRSAGALDLALHAGSSGIVTSPPL